MPRGQGRVNQHRKNTIIEDHPELPDTLQQYMNERVLVKDIPAKLEKLGIHIGLRSVESIMKKHDIKTVRRNGLSEDEIGLAILQLAEDDPLGRWGIRLFQEKLAQMEIHVSRDYIMKFRQTDDPDAAAARHPETRKVHHTGLWSIGPNEEWCVDGHEKLLNLMGIAIWGIADKFARIELALWAVPNARLADVPPALILRLILKLGGMALTTTMDKGSELGKLIPFLTTLRAKYQPHLDESTLPTCNAVKSVYNITRERGWRPLYEKELGNIADFYKKGITGARYSPNNDLHKGISLWLWGKIVQECLDQYCVENAAHRVRFQKKSLLPTGGRRIDFYESPEDYNGKDQLIEIPREDIERLLQEHDRPDLLQFGTDEMIALSEALYSKIGSPSLRPKDGWTIFRQLIDAYAE